MVTPSDAVRLSDVARAAGVSKATASKALNGRPDVSPATRARVLAAVEAMGYEPAAGDLGARYPTIALVADDLATTYTLEVLKGAAAAAMEAGVCLATLYTEDPANSQHPVPLADEWLDLVKARGFLGVVALTAPISERLATKVRAIGLPLVAIDPATRLPAGVAGIGATNWNGGVDATRHLLDLGHRRIAFVAGPPESVPAAERKQGYLSALQMAGVPMQPELISGDSFTARRGSEVAASMLARPAGDRPTAFFCANDVLALGVFDAVRAAGMGVPEDISVVGFDDALLAELVTPGLTTVRQPLAAMGAAAVRTVLDQSKGLAHHGPVRLHTQLVVRGSTGPV